MRYSKPRWYPMFKKSGMKTCGVLDEFSNEELSTMYVIGEETPQGAYNYAVLKSHVHLYEYLMSLDVNQRIFNERVPESKGQKPRFDIDIDNNAPLLEGFSTKEDLGEYVKDTVIEAVLKEIPTATLEKNILIYTSHRRIKVSYHILVDGYIHATCHDAAGFYDKVVPDNIKPYVDAAIYDRNHMLRIMHCHKRTNDCVKVFNQTYQYKGRQIQHHSVTKTFPKERQKDYYLFSLSLITYTAGCTLLPSYAKPKQVFDSQFDSERCGEVMTMLEKRFGPNHLYEFREVNGSIINLTRTKEEVCILCDKLHDANGLPFVYVIGNNAYWTCGRTKQYPRKDGVKRIHIGTLVPDISAIASIVGDLDIDDDMDSIISTYELEISPQKQLPVSIERQVIHNTNVQPVTSYRAYPAERTTYNTTDYGIRPVQPQRVEAPKLTGWTAEDRANSKRLARKPMKKEKK